MKLKIRENQYGNWYGYIGGRRVESFMAGPHNSPSQEEAAKAWLKAKTLEQMRRAYPPENVYTLTHSDSEVAGCIGVFGTPALAMLEAERFNGKPIRWHQLTFAEEASFVGGGWTIQRHEKVQR